MSLCLCVLCGLYVTGTAGAAQRAVRRDVLVAAAASLSAVLGRPFAAALHDATGIDVRFTFASSNVLARQIVEGARVDVLISADLAQMDVVEQAGRLIPDTRVDVLGNRLVVIVSPRRDAVVAGPGDLASAAVRRVALGDPAAVPVGVYARAWLETAGLWTAVAPKVVPLPTSPAVVAAVRERRVDAGIVYATDAMSPSAQSGVRPVYEVPPADAPGIVYPAAVIRGSREADARRVVQFMQSDRDRRIFDGAGFLVPAR
jgi:molybdate transport system substrate-binding protein